MKSPSLLEQQRIISAREWHASLGEYLVACGCCGGDVVRRVLVQTAQTVEITHVTGTKRQGFSFDITEEEEVYGAEAVMDRNGEWCCLNCGRRADDTMLMIVANNTLVYRPTWGM